MLNKISDSDSDSNVPHSITFNSALEQSQLSMFYTEYKTKHIIEYHDYLRNALFCLI